MLKTTDIHYGEATYINSETRGAAAMFADTLRELVDREMSGGRELVLLCIGTDRITGDSLGPIIGHNLVKHRTFGRRSALRPVVYGTLESPVHAKNLPQALEMIHTRHAGPLIVAVDASLGRPQSVGYITIGCGALSPGAGVMGGLPDVGDIYVTGIVNRSGAANLVTLQNTHLALVVKLADVITRGFVRALV